MSEGNHQKRYEELIEEGTSTGRIDTQPPGEERRAHPRFKLDGTELVIGLQLKVIGIEMSRCGASFYSNHKFPVGEQFTLNIGEVFTITGEVVACDLEETDAALLETHYRVRSRFLDGDLELDKLLTIIDS